MSDLLGLLGATALASAPLVPRRFALLRAKQKRDGDLQPSTFKVTDLAPRPPPPLPTGLALERGVLITNVALRKGIEELLESFPELRKEQNDPREMAQEAMETDREVAKQEAARTVAESKYDDGLGKKGGKGGKMQSLLGDALGKGGKGGGRGGGGGGGGGRRGGGRGGGGGEPGTFADLSGLGPAIACPADAILSISARSGHHKTMAAEGRCWLFDGGRDQTGEEGGSGNFEHVGLVGSNDDMHDREVKSACFVETLSSVVVATGSRDNAIFLWRPLTDAEHERAWERWESSGGADAATKAQTAWRSEKSNLSWVKEMERRSRNAGMMLSAAGGKAGGGSDLYRSGLVFSFVFEL